MIVGVDIGYGYTKNSNNIKFASKYSSKETLINNSTIKLTYNNIAYTIGEGELTVSMNKISSLSTKLLLITSLGLLNEKCFNVVAGLPVAQFHKYKEELKNELLKDRIIQFTINDKIKHLIIDDVYIFPQCLGAYYTINNIDLTKEYLLVDIGTRTVDIISLYNNKIVKYSTILEGTISMYSDFIHAVNNKYDTNFQVEDAERILKNGLYIYNVRKDLSFAKEIIKSHIDSIYKELELNYNPSTKLLLLSGGGAYLYINVIKVKYPHATLIPDAQFANANGFKKVGESIWQR